MALVAGVAVLGAVLVPDVVRLVQETIAVLTLQRHTRSKQRAQGFVPPSVRRARRARALASAVPLSVHMGLQPAARTKRRYFVNSCNFHNPTYKCPTPRTNNSLLRICSTQR